MCDLRSIAKNLASKAMNLGIEKDEEITKVEPEFVPSFRSKQVLFFRIAILCLIHCHGLTSEEVRIILKCAVRSKNAFVEDDGDLFFRDQLRDSCHYFLTNRLDSFLSVIMNDYAILTEALRTTVETAPTILEWTQEQNSKVSFTAQGNDGHWYSINVLSGIVLIDGLPPNQLPASITDDKEYQRIFGSNNFEVFFKSGEYETLHPVQGCFYRFQITKGVLVVRESQPSINAKNITNADLWDNCVELLDIRTIETWGKDLPKKLKESYSHWASRKKCEIHFRMFDFRNRTPHYVHNMTHCVSSNNNESSVSKFDDNSDVLVTNNSPILNVFKRLESIDFIHTFRTREAPNRNKGIDCTRFDLYRFGLTFTLKCSKDEKSFSPPPDEPLINVVCDQISGYCLSSTQHNAVFFPGLHQYVILKPIAGGNDKIIIPFGIIENKNGETMISSLAADLSFANARVEADIHFFEYDIHSRFNNLYSKSICSRLFLASLFFATGSCIPGEMTGEEKAIEIVRECWLNRPLSVEEEFCLKNLVDLSRGKSPTLSLLCHDIKRSTNEFRFLHDPCGSKLDAVDNTLEFSKDATVYQHYASGCRPLSPRCLLNCVESQRILGCGRTKKFQTTHRRIAKEELYDLEKSPITVSDVKKINQDILGFWCEKEEQPYFKEFPLYPDKVTNLEKTTYEELKNSWSLHCKQQSFRINLESDTKSSLKVILRRVMMAANDVFKHIINSLALSTNIDNTKHWHAQAIQYFRLSHIVPIATKRDVASFALDPNRMSDFNPLLSTTSIEKIKSSIICWLELCVLEDKINFLLSFDSIESNKDFLRELMSSRDWSTHEHPYWLIYEMEQCIRIRPEQFEIANHLINNHKGDVVQLNMGLGKTRVILPMLILFYSFQNTNDYFIPRLCILKTLLSEVSDYFLGTLSASVLGRKLFFLPFQRDVELDEHKISLLLDLVNHCKETRGFLVVAPEHRMSLILKTKELYLAGNITLSESLAELVHFPWHDIFDEVDEILHHRYQLVYSIGAVKPLPQMTHRWRVAEAVLHMMKNASMNGIKINDNEFLESYPRIAIDDTIDVKHFRKTVAQLLFSSPPRGLDWLKNHPKQVTLHECITNAGKEVSITGLPEDQFYDILALRGLIAYDVFIHCLKKRHKVDFGVNLAGRKSLAVPYRGADTPSLRSEFSHPDCALVLTLISYYDLGLDEAQLKRTFEFLLLKGNEARTQIYSEWLEISKLRMKKDDIKAVSKVDKIDLTNMSQFSILFHYFRNNYRTVNFWINTCVFPKELDLYPHRLVGNSWHLASNKDCRVVGFSGTNDNHRILPLHVQQYLPWKEPNNMWSRLLSTNGMMLDLIIQKNIECRELSDGKPNESLLNLINLPNNKDLHVCALIDAGALLVGVSIREAANAILKGCLFQNMPSLKGVTFFDTSRQSNGAWVILERSGRCLQKDQSPMKEKDTFAIFDEPRCRGVDLKLRHNATAILTLGQNMRKDKFMQAAGRLRQLHNNQRIMIVGEKRIFNEIREKRTSNCVSREIYDKKMVETTCVLSWIMQNTIGSIVKGLNVWCDQGIFFETEEEPCHSMLKDKQELKDFYMKPINKALLPELAHVSKKLHFKRTNKPDNYETTAVDEIVSRCEELGKGYSTYRSSMDEECERELEREVEVEEEKEIEFDKMTPKEEADWNFSSVFCATSCQEVSIRITPLSTVIRESISNKNVSKISWSKKIFCTENFVHTIVAKNTDSFDSFLRMPDCLLRFFNGDVLLLSDREAAQILPLFLDLEENNALNAKYPYFGHCAFESKERTASIKNQFLQCNLSNESGSLICKLECEDSCSLKLFNGNTMYNGQQYETLRKMLSQASCNNSSDAPDKSMTVASGEPEVLVAARGKLSSYDMSDLERMSIEIRKQVLEFRECLQLCCKMNFCIPCHHFPRDLLRVALVESGAPSFSSMVSSVTTLFICLAIFRWFWRQMKENPRGEKGHILVH